LLNTSVTQSVYVPGIGFRAANALRMPVRTIVRQGERALAVVSLVSSEAGTEVSFEIKDDRLEEACLAGKVEHSALWNLDVRLRDEDGNSYARSLGAVGRHFSRPARVRLLPPRARLRIIAG